MKDLWKCMTLLATLSWQALPALAQEETRPAPAPTTQAPLVDCCNTCCSNSICNACSSCDKGCMHGGFTGGFEFLLLKPHNSEGNAPVFDALTEIINEIIVIGDPTIGSIAEPDWEHEPSYRLWLGYQIADGLGIRATYFSFDNDVSALSALDLDDLLGATLDVGLDYAIEARAFDLEVIQSFEPCCKWHFLIGGGYRYAEYRETNALSINLRGDGPGEFIGLPNLLTTGFDSQSHGLTLCGEARRRLGNFALFAGTRGSILFGDENEIININLGELVDPEITAIINSLLTENEEENVKFIFEARLGEYNYELRNGSIAFARLTAEAQYWDNFTGTPLFDSNGSFGLFGIGLGVGLYR